MQPVAPLRCPAAALASQGASWALGRRACPVESKFWASIKLVKNQSKRKMKLKISISGRLRVKNLLQGTTPLEDHVASIAAPKHRECVCGWGFMRLWLWGWGRPAWWCVLLRLLLLLFLLPLEAAQVRLAAAVVVAAAAAATGEAQKLEYHE